MALFLINPVVSTAIGLLEKNGVDTMACITIAKTEDLSKYKIDNTYNDNVPTPDFSKPSGVVPSTEPDTKDPDTKEPDTQNDDTDNEYVILINPSHQVLNQTVSKDSSDKYKTEKASMYVLANILKKKLTEKGYQVVLAPDSGNINNSDGCWDSSDGNSNDSNSKWAKCADKQVSWCLKQASGKKTIYIALHSNAGNKIGPVVYYANGKTESQKLSNNVCDSLIAVYENNDHKPTNDGCSSTSAGVSEPKRYYDQGGKEASILIEIGYHDNEKNQKFIEKRGNKLANGIVKGIENYLGK